LSVRVQALLQKHEGLKNIISIIGEDELSPADRDDYSKARQLIQFFSQYMFVTEQFNNHPGEFVSREDTLKGVEAILK
jgi:F-type H+-transporting ATPase subunit beta